jgi:uncharacterized small protein (DUF1192 family)
VIASSRVRAIVLSGRSVREMEDRMPAAGERIDGIAAERQERDAGRPVTRTS